jgi:hypothetical protein
MTAAGRPTNAGSCPMDIVGVRTNAGSRPTASGGFLLVTSHLPMDTVRQPADAVSDSMDTGS